MCSVCCRFSCQPGCSQPGCSQAVWGYDSRWPPAMALTLTQAGPSFLESLLSDMPLGPGSFCLAGVAVCSRVSGSLGVSCTVTSAKRLCAKSMSVGKPACQCWQPVLSRSGLQGWHPTFTSSGAFLYLSPTPPICTGTPLLVGARSPSPWTVASS